MKLATGYRNAVQSIGTQIAGQLGPNQSITFSGAEMESLVAQVQSLNSNQQLNVNIYMPPPAPVYYATTFRFADRGDLNVQDGSNAVFNVSPTGVPIYVPDGTMGMDIIQSTVDAFNAGAYDGLIGVVSLDMTVSSTVANQGGQQSQQTNGDNGNFWPHLIGPGLIGLGQPITALKPIGMLGSKPGSSIASYTLRKVVPGTLKGTFGEEVGGALAEVASTNGIGAALGRFVPVAGWIWTYTDATWTYFNWTLDSAPTPQARQELLNDYNSLP